MKVAIVYKSITGNTKQLAEAIQMTLKQESIVYCGQPQDAIDADLYFIGSWTDKGMCDQEIRSFLQMLNHKQVAYFQTAGFGGSKSYYDNLLERAKEHLNDTNECLGSFFCQGKMPIGVRNRYVNLLKEHPEDRKLQISIENFDNACSHPDVQDLNNVQLWALEMIKKARKL